MTRRAQRWLDPDKCDRFSLIGRTRALERLERLDPEFYLGLTLTLRNRESVSRLIRLDIKKRYALFLRNDRKNL